MDAEAPVQLPQIPGYRLTAVLRTGGMSTLYAGEALQGAAAPLGAAVAVKLLHPQLLTEVELVMRFHNEAALLMTGTCEGLVRAYESGHLRDEVPYLVLERLSHSLADVLDSHATGLPEQTALTVAQALAAALSRLHEEGIIHRDLKPANIMFAGGLTGTTALRLIDLGLAKIDALRRLPVGATPWPFLRVSTADTAVLGTYEYMAPEQCLNPKEVRAQSDVYSLGVVIYQILTGQLPFSDSSAKRLMSKHLWDEPPLARVRPRALRKLLAELLGKEPEPRPTAAEVSTRLGRLLEKIS